MRWSKEKIWEWYDSRPWMRGCNYMSADCANRIDQWQELGFEERFKTTEEELKLMQETGFNTVRLIIEYVVNAVFGFTTNNNFFAVHRDNHRNVITGVNGCMIVHGKVSTDSHVCTVKDTFAFFR